MSAWVPAFGGKMEEGSGMTGVMCGSTPRTLYLERVARQTVRPLVFETETQRGRPAFSIPEPEQLPGH